METPKGMRDFLPEEMIFRKEVMEKIEEKYKLYGFRPLESPAIEKISVLTAKSGEEIAGEIFRIEESDIGLRFDLTVPLARIAANNPFPKPFKRYCIGRVWRREEPQKGRYREFWQADADIIGTKEMRAEGELLSMVLEILEEFGFKNPKIYINNRKILNKISEKLNLKEKSSAVFRLLDKRDKIGEERVIEELTKEIGKEKTQELIEVLKAREEKESLKIAKEFSEEGAREIEEILEMIKGNAIVDLSLVRGLGYYTGPIFEIKLSKEIGTIAAGGRYDELLKLYGQGDYATGISIGVERLIYLLKEREEKKEGRKKTYTKIFIAPVKEENYPFALKVAEKLRKRGIPTEIDLNKRNLRKQMDYANSLNIPYVAVIGNQEEKEEVLTLRDMKTGKQEKMKIEEVIEKIKERKVKI